MDTPKKSVQVRIPTDLHNDVAVIAPALGKTIPEYTEEVLRAAAERDMPKALEQFKRRVERRGRKASEN